VKGHEGNLGNEESDRLAKEGASKPETDELNLEIPIEFDIQGAKLKTLTQALAYKGIQERNIPDERETTNNNLAITRAALATQTGEIETDETLWKGTRNPTIRIRIRQFLYKAMHSTQKIGDHWRSIPRYQHRQLCRTCNTVESMEHILINCEEIAVRTIWELAKNFWPYEDTPWPDISIGTILGCGSIKAPRAIQDQDRDRTPHQGKGPTRLLQILISESGHLIWILRCERAIQGKNISETEAKARWHKAINRRLTEDKITATKIRPDKRTIRKVRFTWEAALRKSQVLPDRWLHNREVLVGRRAGPRPAGDPNP
jgi:hypothetical protein